MEHIDAYIRPPWWTPKASTQISQTNKKEAAKKSPKTTTTDYNRRLNHIYRWIRLQWTYRCSNILIYNGNSEGKICRHGGNSQCLCSRINGNPNGQHTIRREDQRIQECLHLHRQPSCNPGDRVSKTPIRPMHH